MGIEKRYHILVVDDNVTNLKFAEVTLKPIYKVTSLISGEQALKFLSKNIPDLILLDIKMPGMDGFDTIKEIKANINTRNIPVIFLTAMSESESELMGLALGATDFISKPFVPEVMLRRIAMQIELKNYRDNLENIINEKTKMVEKLQDAIVTSVTDLVEFRDKITGGHAKRTALYLKIFVNNLRQNQKYSNLFTDEYVANVLRAAPLHDVGKIGINDNILTKNGSLDDSEFEYMKLHTSLGGLAFENALDEVPGNEFIMVAKDMALYHHECWDGTGYPFKLSGENIPFCARIMAIVDVYDALTTKRPYKEPYSHEQAVEIINSRKGRNFQPELVEEFNLCSEEFKKQHSLCEEML